MDMIDAEREIKDMKAEIAGLPDKIAEKINSTMDLKIENAIQKVKIDFYKLITPVCIGAISALVSAIFSLVKVANLVK